MFSRSGGNVKVCPYLLATLYIYVYKIFMPDVYIMYYFSDYYFYTHLTTFFVYNFVIKIWFV